MDISKMINTVKKSMGQMRDTKTGKLKHSGPTGKKYGSSHKKNKMSRTKKKGY